MRAAPAAEAALASGRAERAALLALHLATAAVLAWWLHSHARHSDAGLGTLSPAWWLAGLLAAGLAMGRLGWVLGRRSMVLPGCRLRWDAQQWWLLLPADAAGPDPLRPLAWVGLQLDLGPWLLLRLQPAGAGQRAVWAVCAAGPAGPAWHGLKVALLAHAGAPAKPPAAAAPAG